MNNRQRGQMIKAAWGHTEPVGPDGQQGFSLLLPGGGRMRFLMPVGEAKNLADSLLDYQRPGVQNESVSVVPLMQTALRVVGTFSRDERGELAAAFGVDVQAPSGAPGGESLRVDVSLDGDSALAAQLLDRLLGPHSPLAEGSG